MDTARPLLKTKGGHKHIIVSIYHYLKWNKTKVVPNHRVKTATKFFEDEIICRYVVPKFVIINNVGEWLIKFDIMCKNYGIAHQFMALKWPQCNGMVEQSINSIKHGITILSSTHEHMDF
jgi:hypothetical protein